MKAISIFGKVQGVFFRKNVLQKAEELELRGYVKNMDNGSVYIEAEGDKDMENQLIEWCKSSPGASKVDNVESQELPNKNYSIFEIKA